MSAAKENKLFWPSAALLVLVACLLSVLSGGVAARDYYFDQSVGNDKGSGDLASPYRSIDKLNALAPTLRPGDRVLLSNKSLWRGQIQIYGVNGNQANQIEFLSYGPVSGGRAKVRDGNGGTAIRIYNSSYVAVKGLHITGSDGGPCMVLDYDSGEIELSDNLIENCASNGVFIRGGVHDTLIVGNTIGRVSKNDGITIHEINWGVRAKDNTWSGPRHVIANNSFLGPFGEDAIDVSSRGVRDIFIINNTVENSHNAGIQLHNCSNVFIDGNTLRNNGTQRRAGTIKVAADTRGPIEITNNTFESNHMSGLLVYSSLSPIKLVGNRIESITNKPVIWLDAVPPAIEIRDNEINYRMKPNLFFIKKHRQDASFTIVDNRLTQPPGRKKSASDCDLGSIRKLRTNKVTIGGNTCSAK